MIKFQRLVQSFCLVLFLTLLTIASISDISMSSLEIFLQMDPGLIFITAISGRIVLLSFIPTIIILISGPFIGRVFCGYICPMGTTLDGTDALSGFKKNTCSFSENQFKIDNFLKLKYLILIFLFGSALFGVSYVFWASPLSLITRFYGLIVFPVISFLAREGLDIVRPFGDMLDISSIGYAQIRTIRFSTQFFILFFFLTVFGMVTFSPRFWCRYLCPSGALLAVFSRTPIIRRQVSDKCTQCGKCVKKCPMAAIEIEEPDNTFHSECIVCRTCEEVCPEDAVFFGVSRGSTPEILKTFSPERRQIVATGLLGAGTAVMSLTGLNSLYGKPGEGQVGARGLIRPPGALIETDFLSRCVRCGECMIACPTNTLQPIWLAAGFPALFSPAITPRRGFCDPQCHECGTICPTNAIRPIEKKDRTWAKTGTALIIRQKCLAWEFAKSCMVCDEVCPYDAIEFLNEQDNGVPVPHVMEDRCAGCGYCEYFCPVQNQAAIIVTPMDAFRINHDKYETHARNKGFMLHLKSSDQKKAVMESYPRILDGTAPGFDEGNNQ